MASDGTLRSTVTRRAAGVFALAVWGGCGAEHAVVQTDNLEIELYDSDVICRGSLRNMAAQVTRLSAVLSVQPREPIHVHYGYAAVEAHCSGAQSGCTRSDRVVVATEVSIHHELVHALRFLGGAHGTRFFEEGIAELLGGFRPYPYDVTLRLDGVTDGPASLATRPRDAITAEDYATAGHFMSWLWSTFGDDSVVAFLDDERYATADAVDMAFAEHFGLTLEEADASWRATAAETYAWGDLCERELVWSGSQLTFDGEADCAEPNTFGPGYDGRIATRGDCFMLEAPGSVRVELNASTPRATVTFRQFACARDDALGYEYYDVRIVNAGEPEEILLGACAWEVSVTNPGLLVESRTVADPIEFSLRLTRL